jgi:hypothetical protein
MWRRLATARTGIAALLLAGCATGPLVENPVLIRSDKVIAQENPLYIPQGQGAATYARVFEKTLDVLDDYFEIAYMSRYEGRIETQPTVAPGLEQPWKPGSPDCYQRLLAFLQTIRHRAIVIINTADDGGYWISVKVLKELEDLPVPVRATAGAATFRMNTTVERQFEVIETGVYQAGWIPIGRDYKLEQVILERLAKCDFKSLPKPTPVSGP